MAVYKEEKTNTWRVIYRYTDWKGERRQSQKRGFATKREAQAWEREQLNKTKADLDMTFASFVDTYTEDMKSRIKENTWHTKEHIMRTKILPYFRVSAEENELINKAVKLSGLPKQEYCYRRCLGQDIVVVGNPRVYKALKDELQNVLTELKRIENENVTEELLQTIQLITLTLQGLKEDE